MSLSLQVHSSNPLLPSFSDAPGEVGNSHPSALERNLTSLFQLAIVGGVGVEVLLWTQESDEIWGLIIIQRQFLNFPLQILIRKRDERDNSEEYEDCWSSGLSYIG